MKFKCIETENNPSRVNGGCLETNQPPCKINWSKFAYENEK